MNPVFMGIGRVGGIDVRKWRSREEVGAVPVIRGIGSRSLGATGTTEDVLSAVETELMKSTYRSKQSGGPSKRPEEENIKDAAYGLVSTGTGAGIGYAIGGDATSSVMGALVGALAWALFLR